jgi:hypothetical protein
MKNTLKGISILLCIVMIGTPIKYASAEIHNKNDEQQYQDIQENEKMILEHLTADDGRLFQLNESFLGKDLNNGDYSTFVVGSESTVYAPNGGMWLYSYGGPTSTLYNGQIRYDKIIYMTRDEIISTLGNNVTATKWKNLKELLISSGIAAAKNYANMTFTGALKAFLGRLFVIYGAVELIVPILEDIEDAQYKDILVKARDNGNGIIFEYYEYTYNGFWYDGSIKTEWTNEPYAPIPGSAYGVGTFSKNVTTGWYQISNRWYWYENGEAVISQWREIDGYWYYFKSDGVMATSWQYIGGKWYFFWDGGSMAKSWVKVNGVWYYLDPTNGDMKTGWQQIGGTWYYFYSSGAMATNVTIDGWWIDGNGVAHQP